MIRSHPVTRLVFAIAALAFAGGAFASCGSATCPIDPMSLNLPREHEFTLDLSDQYIDQDRLFAGRHAIAAPPASEVAGELERRTINRVATLAASYALSNDLIVSAALPYISRFHEHVSFDDDPAGQLQRWRLSGIGDASLGLRYRVFPRIWASAAVKLPTGNRSAENDLGESAEPTIAPGTGSTDVTLGLQFQSSLLVPSLTEGMMGNTAAMPFFAGVTVRRDGRGTDDYRGGDELQAVAGANYPLFERLQILFQLNARFKTKDDVGRTDAVRDHTGGSFVYASPGVRWTLSWETALYGYVQIPLYQRLNGINITSRYNWIGGFQIRL